MLASIFYVLGALFFAAAAVFGMVKGQLPSIRGGMIEKKNGPFMFGVCVALYLAMATLLLFGAFVF